MKFFVTRFLASALPVLGSSPRLFQLTESLKTPVDWLFREPRSPSPRPTPDLPGQPKAQVTAPTCCRPFPLGPTGWRSRRPASLTYVQNGIILQVDTNPTIDVALKVGSVNEQVVVEAAAAMVETQSTGVGQVINSAAGSGPAAQRA